MEEFETSGARFNYPESWSVTDESSQEALQATALSPGGAFWALVIVAGPPTPEALIESVEIAYRDDYPDGDVGPRGEGEGPHGPTLHTQAEFWCLDLAAVARAQAFRAGGRSVLVLTQVAEVEREEITPVFEAMTASLRLDEDSPGDGPAIGW